MISGLRGYRLGMVLPVCAMEESSCQSRRDYADFVEGRSETASEEVGAQLGTRGAEGPQSNVLNQELKGKSVKDEEQGTPTVRKFQRIGSNRRNTENVENLETAENGKHSAEVVVSEMRINEENQREDGFNICGYELRAPQGIDALRRLSMEDVVVTKDEEKSQTLRTKVQDEVLKVLFGPPDAKTLTMTNTR